MVGSYSYTLNLHQDSKMWSWRWCKPWKISKYLNVNSLVWVVRMCNSLQLSIVQKLVMSTFPHLGSGGRQGVVCSRYLGMLISTQYTLDTCVVLLLVAGGGTVIAARRVSPPPLLLVTWHLACTVSQLQSPDPGPEATLGTTNLGQYIHSLYITHSSLCLSVFHFLFAVETLETVF